MQRTEHIPTKMAPGVPTCNMTCYSFTLSIVIPVGLLVANVSKLAKTHNI